MKEFVVLFSLFFVSLFGFSQKKYAGQVLDKNTNKPIEFVDIFNSKNYTITNADGKFNFSSSKDSIKFNFLGYKEYKTLISKLPENGIINLITKDLQLDEVIVSNKNTTYNKMARTIRNDSLARNFKEEFFLRTLLKKDDTIIKLQDINGIVDRKTLFPTTTHPMPKKNVAVCLKNMRKGGFDIENIHFNLNDFNFLFKQLVSISAPPSNFRHKKSIPKDSSIIKLNIYNKSKKSETKGYYIINPESFHLQKAFWERNQTVDYTKNGPFLRYRTTNISLMTSFYLTKINKSYRINNAKLTFKVEAIYKDEKPIIYDVIYIYKTIKNSDVSYSPKNKVSVKKDVFKLKHPYNEVYWNNNQHLKLTDKMVSFLNSLTNSEYKVKTNFKD